MSGLNLHVFSFVSDQGHPATVAALGMSTIAFMYSAPVRVGGLCAERLNIGRVIMAKFIFQGAGISLGLVRSWFSFAIWRFFSLWHRHGRHFDIGGIDLGQLFWPHFPRQNPRMGSLVTHAFSAGGAPFFGFLYDATQSYLLLFSIFIGLLLVSAVELFPSATVEVSMRETG